MPPNVTSLIQPMDQNVIRLTKLHYKNSLAAMVIANDSGSIKDFFKKFTLKDVIFLLENAWNKITARTIQNCWKKILKTDEEDEESEDDIPLSRLAERLQNDQFNQWDDLVSETVDVLNKITNGKVKLKF